VPAAMGWLRPEVLRVDRVLPYSLEELSATLKLGLPLDVWMSATTSFNFSTFSALNGI